MGRTGHIMETLAKAYQKYEATKSDKKKDLWSAFSLSHTSAL